MVLIKNIKKPNKKEDTPFRSKVKFTPGEGLYQIFNFSRRKNFAICKVPRKYKKTSI